MAVPKFITNDMKGGYVGGPTTPARRCYVGGTLVYQGFGPASEQEFIQQTATGGPAQLLKVYGKTIVNNQQAPEFSATYWAGVGVTDLTFTSGEVSFTPNNDGLSSYITIRNAYPISNISGHKYFFAFDAKKDAAGSITLRFGAGYIYRIISVTTTYARYAAIVASTGSGYNTNNWICGQVAGVKTYVKNFVFIDLTTRFGAGNEPTSVDKALRLLGGDAFDPAYDPGSLQSNKTTELRAYDGGTLRGSLALNLSTLTGKLNGEGASVAVFPDGLRGVGTDRDEAYGSTGEVRLGKRAYQAGDESDTSVLTDGTNTIYPLATPLTYTLDTPLPTDLTCVQGDILQRVSDNNCPFVGEMKFGL